MSKRKDLQKLLEQTLGSRNVYFQPPATIKMQYPAIRYELVEMHTKRADVPCSKSIHTHTDI